MSPAEPGPVVLWRLGEALLAVDLAAVEEIAPVDDSGQVRARSGTLELVSPPGLPRSGGPAVAVILRGAGGAGTDRMALAADGVEGVVEPTSADEIEAPGWLAGLDAPHLAGLIRVHERRVAALLDPAALFRGP